MKAFTSSLFALTALASGLLATGCGSLSDDANSERVLTTLHGQLDNPQSVALSGAGSNVRVAVIWRDFTTDGEAFSVAEDLPVQPVFPSAFTIEITAPPPASAMNSGAVLQQEEESPPTSNGNATPSGSAAGSVQTPTTSGPSGSAGASSGSGTSKAQDNSTTQFPADFQFAVGQVVAYQDDNGNGKLDLVGDDATAYTDTILGANENLVLVYFSGTMPSDNYFADTSGKLPTSGYNIFQIPNCIDVTETCDTTTAWFDMSTLYDLPISNDPTLNELMCESGDGSSSSGSSNAVDPTACATSPGIVQATYPTPDAGSCASDGSYFTTTTCTTTNLGPCKGTSQTCTATLVCRPAQPNASWPCPAQ